jgi:hypothetical protein
MIVRVWDTVHSNKYECRVYAHLSAIASRPALLRSSGPMSIRKRQSALKFRKNGSAIVCSGAVDCDEGCWPHPPNGVNYALCE